MTLLLLTLLSEEMSFAQPTMKQPDTAQVTETNPSISIPANTSTVEILLNEKLPTERAGLSPEISS